MKKFLFSFVLASVLFTACDKQEVTPPQTTNTPFLMQASRLTAIRLILLQAKTTAF